MSSSGSNAGVMETSAPLINRQQAVDGRPPQYAPAPCDLDLVTLKVVSESRVTWANFVSIIFLGLSVLDLGPMYTTDVREHHR